MIIFVVSVVLLFKFLNTPHKPPILGVYQQRNKYFWLKFICMYIVLRIKQFITYLKRLLAVEMGQSPDGGVHVHASDSILEQKYYLSDNPLAVDAVYLNGMSKEGAAVICGVARRPSHFCDAFLYLKVKEDELLLSPSLPKTYLKQETVEEGEYRAQGISMTNFIPMRTWKLVYNGDMKPRNNPEKTIKVEVSLTWSANWSPFLFDYHMSPSSLAADLSRESWSTDFFKCAKRYHQVHYEQMGFIKGTVKVDGEEHVFNMPCIRDHSFGKIRDWGNFHRYVLHFLFLENGDCLAVGCVSKPVISSHVTIGYYCRKSDQAVFPVDSTDFKLYQHGENQIMPKDYGFTFNAGGESYTVQVVIKDEDMFYIGNDKDSKIYERWCSVVVNDIKGWGCTEWQYNNLVKRRVIG